MLTNYNFKHRKYDFVNLSLTGNILFKNCLIYNVGKDWIQIISIDSILYPETYSSESNPIIISIPIETILDRTYADDEILLFAVHSNHAFVKEALEHNFTDERKNSR